MSHTFWAEKLGNGVARGQPPGGRSWARVRPISQFMPAILPEWQASLWNNALACRQRVRSSDLIRHSRPRVLAAR